jgi:hypothetical protein
MSKIRVVVLDGLEAEDVLKLHVGGFFEQRGVAAKLPEGATGQEAVLVKVVQQPVAEGYDANARDAVEQAEAKVAESKPVRKKAAPVREEAPKVAEQPAEQPKAEDAPSVQESPSEPFPQTLADLARDRIEGEARIEERRKAKLAKNDGAVTPDVATLATFTKFRDVVQHLLDSGVVADDIAKVCDGIKEQVPLLQRIPNLEERVARTLEVMGVA